MEYFFTARRRSAGRYTDEIGPIRYLEVPEDAPAMVQEHEVSNSATWFNRVQHAAKAGNASEGTVLFYVHGFNTEQHEMRTRHKKIVAGLKAQGFDGVVVSYDWPSDGELLSYASDRADARAAANGLLGKGLYEFVRRQTVDCQINVHVLAHSMGCFVLREAFDYADDNHEAAQTSWSVSQIALVAADISSKSMLAGSPKSSSLLRHAARVTNYYNPYDGVLSISGVKRVGLARRLGRVGLPDPRSVKTVNLNCGPYFDDHRDDFDHGLRATHTWYFDSPRFFEDLAHTLAGALDRDVIPRRERGPEGGLVLRP
ncbi:MAG: alpha/beta hydrolase [Sedimentitalea sp.]